MYMVPQHTIRSVYLSLSSVYSYTQPTFRMLYSVNDANIRNTPHFLSLSPSRSICFNLRYFHCCFHSMSCSAMMARMWSRMMAAMSAACEVMSTNSYDSLVWSSAMMREN